MRRLVYLRGLELKPFEAQNETRGQKDGRFEEKTGRNSATRWPLGEDTTTDVLRDISSSIRFAADIGLTGVFYV